MAGGIALQSSSGGTVTFTVPETSTSRTVSLDFTSLKSTNGYQKLADGVIIQWGIISDTASTTGSITFPITFTNSTYVITGSLHTLNGQGGYLAFGSQANATVSWQRYSTGGTQQYRWIAIGY